MSRDEVATFPGAYDPRREEFVDVDSRTISEGWTLAQDGLEKKATGLGPMQGEEAPEPRGRVLEEAINIINGERQDVYGSPEDSFSLISDYWTTYLRSRSPEIANAGFCLFADDVALMMVLFKIAREANQHKRDNIIDAAGYLGIYADMQERK